MACCRAFGRTGWSRGKAPWGRAGCAGTSSPCVPTAARCQSSATGLGPRTLVEPRGLGSPPRWAYLAGAPGRADALLRNCAGLRGCGRLSLCTHPSFNVRLARLSLMSLLYISKRDAGAVPRQALNIGAAPGPLGQNTARFERRIADLADGVPAPLYADAGLHARGPSALSCSPIFLLTCALCFGSVS